MDQTIQVNIREYILIKEDAENETTLKLNRTARNVWKFNVQLWKDFYKVRGGTRSFEH